MFWIINLMLLPGALFFGCLGKIEGDKVGYRDSFAVNVFGLLYLIGFEFIIWYFCKTQIK